MHKTLERLLNWSTGLMAAMALFSIMWLTLIDVTGRKFFNNSVPGGLEMTEILMVIVIFGALPWCPGAASMWCSIRWTDSSRTGSRASRPASCTWSVQALSA
jgi:hypothetical protein